MKIFLLICLAIGLATTDKLDRTYLPPPGSKYSGGSAGDIQVPLEFPKETFSTQRPIEDGTPELELGINRRPKPIGITQGSTQTPGSTFFQSSYPIPKTTTSYAFTQTTTFAPVEDYEGLYQPSGFSNASVVQQSGLPKYPLSPGQTFQQQPSRGQPGQGQNYSQYQQGQQQPTLTPFGSTNLRPQFASNLKGLEYLPPLLSSGFKGQAPFSQDSSGYPSGLPKRPQYQNGQRFPTPGSVGYQDGQQFIIPGSVGQNKYIGNQNTPSSTVAPQYQDRQRFSTPGSVEYQDRQQFIIPGSGGQNEYTGNQNIPSSTVAPQYQDRQRFSTPGSVEDQDRKQFIIPGSGGQNEYTVNQNIPSSTVAPQYHDRQRFSTPGSVEYQDRQQFIIPGSGGQNEYTGNQNIPSSTVAPQYQDRQRFSTPGSVEDQDRKQFIIPGSGGQNEYTGNQNIPSSTFAPQYQDRQRFSTPGSVEYQDRQQFIIPGSGGQNEYTGNQNIPSSTVAPQYQDGQRFSTPGSIGQSQYSGNQIFPSSTALPRYQNGQRFSTAKPVEQNQYFAPSGAPQYQNGQGITPPGSEEQGYGYQVPNQQKQLQYPAYENLGSQNIPASTAAPQYQNGQQVSSSISGQQNQYLENQNVPTITDTRYQDKQRLTTLGSQQGYPKPIQQFPSSTALPQFQDSQVFTTPRVQQSYGARLPTEQNYLGSQTLIQNGNQQYASTVAPQYQQTFAPTPEDNQQGFRPNINLNQYPLQPSSNQQFPSTTAPQRSDGIQTIPGTAAPFPAIQGTQRAQTSSIYGKQPVSPQLGRDSQVYGTTPSASTAYNQGFPSTTVGPSPTRDFSSIPGYEAFGQRRLERPQAASDRTAEILSYENVLTPEGYSYSYDTSNGIHADETGTVGEGTRAQGGFSYTGDDGKVYSIFYSADENGFQPRGDHLPTPPPIPEAIQRVIEQANKDKESGISDDGSYNDEKYGYMKYDRPLPGLRSRNKTVSYINEEDIPNASKNRLAEQNKKQSKPKGTETQKNNGEVILDETEDISEQDRNDDDEFDDSDDKGVKRIFTDRPSKNFTTEVYRKYQPKGNLPIKMTVNAKIDLVENRRPVDKSYLNRRPMSDKKSQENVPGDASGTDNLEDTEDLQGSQDLDDELDLVSYRDDPSSRTDFHGLNKYLPNAKSSKDKPMVRPDGTRQPSLEIKKSERPGNRKTQVSQKIIPSDEQDLSYEDRKRIPSTKNKVIQTVKDQAKVKQPDIFETDGELLTYKDEETKIYEGKDEYTPIEGVPANKQGTNQFQKSRKMKPTTSMVIQRNGISQDKIIKPTEEVLGYEYNVPQKQFDTEGTTIFPSRTAETGKTKVTSQMVTQSTLRPFMTPNVYGDVKEPTESDEEQYDSRGKPVTAQDENYPGTKLVDGFGRPISSTKAPGYDITNKPTYSVTQGSRVSDTDEFSQSRPGKMEEKSRPTIGRFGVTSAPTQGPLGQYQGSTISTSAPIGEDFSGSRQPPRFDSETGYHYK